MCYKCDGFSETIEIKHPYELFNLVEQLKEVINEGTMRILESNCNLDDIRKNSPFPEDVIYHVFQCTDCNLKFSLCVETYHGSGGTWEVMPDKDNGSLSETNTIEVNWERFFSLCLKKYNDFKEPLKHILDDIEMPEDIKVVIVVQFEENSKNWVNQCIPILNYQKPINCVKKSEGLILLKSALMSVPC